MHHGERPAQARTVATERRQHERVRLMTKGTFLLDTSRGLRTVNATVVDVSAGGAGLRLHTQVWPGDLGRLKLQGLSDETWFPIVVKWVRADADGWTIGVAFDRPPPHKRELLNQLLERLGAQTL